MRMAFLVVGVLAIDPHLVRAQDLPGPSPSFIVVSKIDTAKATIEHLTTVIRHVPETRVQEVVEGGVVKKVTVTVFVPVQETVRQAINLREAKVFDVKGKTVPVG